MGKIKVSKHLELIAPLFAQASELEQLILSTSVDSICAAVNNVTDTPASAAPRTVITRYVAQRIALVNKYLRKDIAAVLAQAHAAAAQANPSALQREPEPAKSTLPAAPEQHSPLPSAVATGEVAQ